MGHTAKVSNGFFTGKNITVVSRSTVSDSFNVYKNKYGKEGANLLKQIKDELSKINDPSKNALFSSFKEEAVKENPDKLTLKSI
jgi:hypothetical protein